MRHLRLILSFYSTFALVSWLITLSCVSIVYAHGIKTFTAVFWFRIITLATFYFFIDNYRKA